jgi:hypothetical protein
MIPLYADHPNGHKDQDVLAETSPVILWTDQRSAVATLRVARGRAEPRSWAVSSLELIL